MWSFVSAYVKLWTLEDRELYADLARSRNETNSGKRNAVDFNLSRDVGFAIHLNGEHSRKQAISSRDQSAILRGQSLQGYDSLKAALKSKSMPNVIMHSFLEHQP